MTKTMTTMTTDRRAAFLVLLLRLSAAALALAALAIFLPESWMAWAHAKLGMGELSRGPLVGYLNRSIAALYAAVGVLTWLIAGDVVRYRPLVAWWGWFHVAFGALMLGVDWYEGMPWFWTAVEGPGLFCAGVLTLVLLRTVPAK